MLSFTADRKLFCSAVARAAAGLPQRPLNPVHAGMLVASSSTERVRMTASDGYVTFTASCEAVATYPESMILPGRMLTEISRYFTGDRVEMRHERKTVTLTSGKSSFSLSCSNGEDYPSWLKPPHPLGKLNAGEFADAVKSVVTASKRDHPVQRGMRLAIEDDRLLMTCTDSSRMAFACPRMEIVAADLIPDPVLAPAVILERFARVAEDEVSLGWSSGKVNLIGVSTPGLEVSAPYVQGKLPDSWVMIRDDYQPQVTLDGAELTQLVKMAALAAGDKGAVQLDFSDVLTVSAAGDAGYSGEMETEGALTPVTLEFTPQYLLDGLTGENVTLAFTGRALLMIGDGYRYILQPRRKLTGKE